MVNILEVDISDLKKEMQGKDKLEALFELVERLNRVAPSVDIDTRAGQLKWKELLFCLVEELFEGANCVPGNTYIGTNATVKLILHQSHGYPVTIGNQP